MAVYVIAWPGVLSGPGRARSGRDQLRVQVRAPTPPPALRVCVCGCLCMTLYVRVSGWAVQVCACVCVQCHAHAPLCSMAPFSTSERRKRRVADRKSLETALAVKQTLEHTVLTHLYPRSQIDVFLQVIQADGGAAHTHTQSHSRTHTHTLLAVAPARYLEGCVVAGRWGHTHIRLCVRSDARLAHVLVVSLSCSLSVTVSACVRCVVIVFVLVIA